MLPDILYSTSVYSENSKVKYVSILFIYLQGMHACIPTFTFLPQKRLCDKYIIFTLL